MISKCINNCWEDRNEMSALITSIAFIMALVLISPKLLGLAGNDTSQVVWIFFFFLSKIHWTGAQIQKTQQNHQMENLLAILHTHKCNVDKFACLFPTRTAN